MFILSAILIICFQFSASAEETCYSSRFQPKCFSNEMIVIKEAYYGRKTLEDCMIDEGTPREANLKDPSFIGCFADVKNMVSASCAGKQECDVTIADIKAETLCYKYLKHYLFASFECIRVAAGSGTCVIKASSEKQHVSNVKLSTSDCGNTQKPWRIESLVGQKINMSLMNIVGNSVSFANEIGGKCDKLGSIVDMSTKKRMDICSTTRMKDSFYVSQTNDVEITFEENRKVSGVVVTIQATGCSDLIPPADAWLKRTGNEATIGCYSTRLRWQLKCQGQRWIGVIGNCSYGHVVVPKVEMGPESEKPASQVVIVFMIVVSGLVMCLLIGCLGVVCLKRYYAISKMKGLKQMNSLVDNFQPVYNKERLNKDPSSFGVNFGGTLSNGKVKEFNGSVGNPDAAQYFELDQSLVNKELLK